MRHRLIALALFASVGLAVPAAAQVSFGVSTPGLSIGINVPTYPQLVRVPGYPVYYAPGLNSNFFFYDGMYWVYQGDNWYASSWYNGPWQVVSPEYVPAYVLRVPVRYYRAPPVYFRGWRADAPPRWGDHWGHSWAQAHQGWDRWDRRAAPAPAPIPSYQRQYSGNRYPHYDQQYSLNNQYYRYQPRDPNVRQHYQQQAAQPPQHYQQGAQHYQQGAQPRQRSTQASPPLANPATPGAPTPTGGKPPGGDG